MIRVLVSGSACSLVDKVEHAPSELSFIMAAEALIAERIEDEDRLGNVECEEASAIGARAIRNAIEADRKNRQPRLVG